MPSTPRVTLLVTKLAWRRLVNRMGSLRRRRAKPGERAAVGRKAAPGKLLLAFMALLFAFQGVTLTTRVVLRAAQSVEQLSAPGAVFVGRGVLHDLAELSEDGACDRGARSSELADAVDEVLEAEPRFELDDDLRAARVASMKLHFRARCLEDFRVTRLPAVPVWPSTALWYRAGDPLRMPKAFGFVALLLALTIVLQTVSGSGRDLTDVDTRLEFLFAFPVRARALFLARLLAMAFTAPMLWVLVFPFYGVVFYCAGLGALALPLGALATLYVGVLGGAARVFAEVVLPRVLSPAALGRLQAVLTVLSYLAMIATIALCLRPTHGGLIAPALAAPDGALFNPASLPLVLAAGGALARLGAAAVASTAVVVAGATVLVAERAVKDGFVSGSGAFQGARGARTAVPRGPTSLLRGGAGKELKALFRDRQLRMQAFVMPLAVVALQIWLNPALLGKLQSNPRTIAAAAFGTAMFTLATGACSLLATEGNALWLLYTAPVGLDRVLLSKLGVWVGVSSLFATGVLVGLWIRAPALLVPTLPYVPLVFVGIGLYAVIATGIGALGTDPLEAEPRHRVRPGAVYLFMLLAALFGYALYSPSWWTKLVQVVLSSLLAYALWQKLRDQLPYLLDPTELPPPKLAVADGVIAALGFFVFQGVFRLLFGDERAPAAQNLLVAFVSAGAFVSLLALFYFRRARLPELFAALGLRRPRDARGVVRALGLGVVAGLAAAAVGQAYLQVVTRLPSVHEALEDARLVPARELTGSSRYFFTALAVLAAPVFEEFIFRGILYGGFRRSLRAPVAALASAAVFGLVHPAVSSLPVFFMAYLAARVYERTRWLAAPMTTHFVYNAVLVAALWRA